MVRRRGAAVGIVVLLQHLAAGVDVERGGGRAAGGDLLLHALVEGVVEVLGHHAAGQVHLGQPPAGVVGVGGHLAGSDPGFGFEAAFLVVGVAVGAVAQHAVLVAQADADAVAVRIVGEGLVQRAGDPDELAA
jgi:hypothetical protein